MRLLIISDVHADAAALERVLADAASRGWERAVFLGDAVGYGAEVKEAVSLLRSLPLVVAIRGNHEVMLDELRAGGRPHAHDEIVTTLAGHLRDLAAEDLGFLDSFQDGFLGDSWGAVHGALRKPFEYLISVPVARANAESMRRDVYFTGHTHVPAAFISIGNEWQVRPFSGSGASVRLPEGARAFLNPGSVSIPRDRRPGASYGIYDEESREFSVHRVL